MTSQLFRDEAWQFRVRVLFVELMLSLAEVVLTRLYCHTEKKNT